jgi:hypothetical protein
MSFIIESVSINERVAVPCVKLLDEGFENTRVPHTSIHRIEADGSWPTGCAGGSLATWLPDLFVPALLLQFQKCHKLWHFSRDAAAILFSIVKALCIFFIRTLLTQRFHFVRKLGDDCMQTPTVGTSSRIGTGSSQDCLGSGPYRKLC